jgi:hypothetical protein
MPRVLNWSVLILLAVVGCGGSKDSPKMPSGDSTASDEILPDWIKVKNTGPNPPGRKASPTELENLSRSLHASASGSPDQLHAISVQQITKQTDEQTNTRSINFEAQYEIGPNLFGDKKELRRVGHGCDNGFRRSDVTFDKQDGDDCNCFVRNWSSQDEFDCRVNLHMGIASSKHCTCDLVVYQNAITAER